MFINDYHNQPYSALWKQYKYRSYKKGTSVILERRELSPARNPLTYKEIWEYAGTFASQAACDEYVATLTEQKEYKYY